MKVKKFFQVDGKNYLVIEVDGVAWPFEVSLLEVDEYITALGKYTSDPINRFANYVPKPMQK